MIRYRSMIALFGFYYDFLKTYSKKSISTKKTVFIKRASHLANGQVIIHELFYLFNESKEYIDPLQTN